MHIFILFHYSASNKLFWLKDEHHIYANNYFPAFQKLVVNESLLSVCGMFNYHRSICATLFLCSNQGCLIKYFTVYSISLDESHIDRYRKIPFFVHTIGQCGLFQLINYSSLQLFSASLIP